MNKEKNQRCVPDSYKAYFVGFNFLEEFMFVFHIGRNFFREIQLQSIRSFMFQQTMPVFRADLSAREKLSGHRQLADRLRQLTVTHG